MTSFRAANVTCGMTIVLIHTFKCLLMGEGAIGCIEGCEHGEADMNESRAFWWCSWCD